MIDSGIRETRAMALCGMALSLLATPAAMAQRQIWARQLGAIHEEGRGVGVDSEGNAFITGSTTGRLAGTNIGEWDLFLAKYDESGTVLWTRQLGTAGSEFAWGVAADNAGNAYVTGSTTGGLAGRNAGREDVFLVKYDASGTRLWRRQMGSTGSDISRAVVVDGAGDVYICGNTTGNLGRPNAGSREAFLAKYDASGTVLWTRQFGTGSDHGYSVAVDGADNVYIAGDTNGSPGGPNAGSIDAFLAKYDASGTRLWTRQIGTSAIDIAYSVAVDGAGNAYLSGNTSGSLSRPNPRSIDAFLAKYDAAGTLLWDRQLGTEETDTCLGGAVDLAGNAYIAGRTNGILGGASVGFEDAYVAKYDTLGTLLWTRQFGTAWNDGGDDVAVDNAGHAYVTGYTSGSFGGPNTGAKDVFLAKFGDDCYSDCDQSTGIGVLDIRDFLCFQNSFVNSEPYACDCDTTTGPLVCDVFDFLCFQNAFVSGCP